MAQSNSVPPQSVPMLDDNFCATTPWWRFFFSMNKNSSKAVAGEVSTPPDGGLSGGGPVADGVVLSIEANGVTNGMLRESTGNSVIGRFQSSDGNVADIVATANNRVLSREGDQLAFRSFINGVSIGPDTAAPLVRCDAFRLDQAPVAGVVVCTHTITFSVNGTDWKMPIVAA